MTEPYRFGEGSFLARELETTRQNAARKSAAFGFIVGVNIGLVLGMVFGVLVSV